MGRTDRLVDTPALYSGEGGGWGKGEEPAVRGGAVWLSPRLWLFYLFKLHDRNDDISSSISRRLAPLVFLRKIVSTRLFTNIIYLDAPLCVGLYVSPPSFLARSFTDN